MAYETIEWAVDGPVATIRLNRPQRMNAVTEAMYRELQHALDRASVPAVRCVVLAGSVRVRDGVRKPAFCAGADLKQHAAGERDAAGRRRYIELAHETSRRLITFPKPVVAAVNGPARGAGAELALACDFIVMAEQATIALPETGLGTFVGGGVTHILPRLVGLARARELIYTGAVLDGPAAAALGLALRCCPPERLEQEVRELAVALAARAPGSLALAKRHLQRWPEPALSEVLRLEAEAILECMETADWKEGLRAFDERREPRFTGS